MSQQSFPLGLKHLGLIVSDLERSRRFYQEYFGFLPYYLHLDSDWAMLIRGGTTLSLIVAPRPDETQSASVHPSHFGLVYETPEAVEEAHRKLCRAGVSSVRELVLHRDGSYGFYLKDPDGNPLECIFIPYAPLGSRAPLLPRQGMILLAHGSADPRWVAPFVAMREKLERSLQPQVEVALAFLERAEPSLEKCVDHWQSSANPFPLIRIIPAFMAGGGAHLSRDVPALVERLKEKYPGTRFELSGALGEHPCVQDAMIAACVEGLLK